MTAPVNTCTSIRPGLYHLTRQFTHAGRWHRNSIECANPADGQMRLDEWEDSIKETKETRKRVA